MITGGCYCVNLSLNILSCLNHSCFLTPFCLANIYQEVVTMVVVMSFHGLWLIMSSCGVKCWDEKMPDVLMNNTVMLSLIHI